MEYLVRLSLWIPCFSRTSKKAFVDVLVLIRFFLDGDMEAWTFGPAGAMIFRGISITKYLGGGVNTTTAYLNLLKETIRTIGTGNGMR